MPLIGFSQNELAVNTKTGDNNRLDSVSVFKYKLSETGINSKLSDVGVAFFRDKFLILSNKKRRHTPTTLNSDTNILNHNTYCVNVGEEGKLSFPLHFSKVLDSEHNEGSATFTQDEQTIYFTKTDNNSSNFKLYKADLDLSVNGYWKNIVEIPVVDPNYSIETPFIDRDDKKMYFSSNIPGGQGGYDIYVADINEDGTLSNIQNLGPVVNSDKDEKFVFVSEDNKYMYFSSKGHNGFGGYDVMRTSLTNSGVANTVNLGPGINTEKDEIAYILSKPNEGYVTINKKEDKEDYDIFYFKFTENTLDVDLLILDSKTNEPLSNVTLDVKDEFGNVIGNLKTDDQGKAVLTTKPLTQLNLTSNTNDYEEQNDVLTASPDSKKISHTISMNKIIPPVVEEPVEVVLSVDNIYFEFDKAIIKNESKKTLMDLVDVLTKYPHINISINAHTDNKGTDSYNQKLSERRAKSTFDFLVKNGIDAARMIYRGYGESQPLNVCNPCSKVQDQENRRVEFKANDIN